MQVSDLKKTIREVPDFPKPGILFYDVTTLFRNPAAFGAVIDRMTAKYSGERLVAVAGIEARGFVLAAALAQRLETGLILLRKEGKLPGEVEGESYSLEYGEARIEAHADAVEPGDRVLVVDDLLATGGTATAAGRLLERLGAKVEGYAFMVELDFLHGRKKLPDDRVFSLIHYEQ